MADNARKAAASMIGGLVSDPSIDNSVNPNAGRAQRYIDRMINDERDANSTIPLVRRKTIQGDTIQYKGRLEQQRDKARGIDADAYDVNTGDNLQIGGLTDRGMTAVRKAKGGSR